LTLNNVWPAASSSGMSITTKVTRTAREDIKAGANFTSITLVDSTGHAVAITTSIYNNMLVIAPVSVLSYSTTYTVTVPVGAVRGVDGAQLVQAQTASFGTESVMTMDLTAFPNKPNISVYTPPATQDPLVFSFNKPLSPSASYAGITLKDASNVSIPLAIHPLGGDEERVLVITPLNQLSYSTVYTLTIPQTSIHDVYGSPLDKSYSITITTEAPLTFTTNPSNNARNVPITRIITLSMSNPTLPGPNFTQITVKDADGRPVNVTTTILGYFSVVIAPVNNLNYHTTYTVFVPQGAFTDTQGSVNGNYTVQFST